MLLSSNSGFGLAFRLTSKRPYMLVKMRSSSFRQPKTVRCGAGGGVLAGGVLAALGGAVAAPLAAEVVKLRM
jgi:hypothetical protein